MNSQIAVSSLQVVENAVKAVRHLRSLGCTDIEFSPEDAGRSDPKFLYRVLAAVIEAGATTLNIPDTTGAPLKDLSCTTSFQAKLRMSALSMPNVLLASTIGGDRRCSYFSQHKDTMTWRRIPGLYWICGWCLPETEPLFDSPHWLVLATQAGSKVVSLRHHLSGFHVPRCS